MLQKNEISKLQNLLAIYQLQTTNGKVLHMSYRRWERDEDGNFIEVNIPDTHENISKSSGNTDCCSEGDICCSGGGNSCSGCDNCCTNCWNCFACCNNTVVCCRCCI